jgi:DNA topoisomerase II
MSLTKQDVDSSEKDTLNKYQKKTDKEHILDNPDTYIGSVETIESNEYIYSDAEQTIIKKQITYNPGLYKLFDEGIVNCRDHVVRMQQALKENKEVIPVSYIDVSISDDGIITMINDGSGIDIAQHPEYKVWIPELIFGHLRTSTNYNKDEKKIVGGKNGFGIKLVLIWSTWGSIETIDSVRGLKYTQEFKNNLDVIGEPKIIKCKNKPYTKIEFKPDYKRLGLSNGLTSDIIALLKRRVYDIAAVTDKSIKVKLNKEIIPVKNFQHYIKLIVGENEMKYEEANERWEYAVAFSKEGEFTQVSFVNGIYTPKGGKHVEYILNQLTRKLIAYIKLKKKLDVKPTTIKEKLLLFIRCDIENPSYDSQTKDYMNTPITKFGSACDVSDKFIEKIAKMGLMDAVCQTTEINDIKVLKKQDGSKSKSIRGIPKLIDANYAGTPKSNNCILILCEGDSAKAGIVSGLSKEDRNIIGIYPMKGKLLNVRGETLTKISNNKEITEIKQILGLEHGKEYTESDIASKLRYGKVLFMTDQDLDGSHIKGLCINLFDTLWSSLICIPDFIGYMNTPILKATKGKTVIQFYNEGEFNLWKQTNDTKHWSIKYYKGLGTSTGKEFKEYFQDKKIVGFKSTGEESSKKIDMVFNKKRSDDRKDWLSNYDRSIYVDTLDKYITYQDFIDKELIHYSTYDNERSICNLMDGLKICLRKIVYSAFKKRLTSEIKVAQFSGYVSEHSGYHHGEASLNSAIVGLAQNFTGSNNINLLEPNGQFGTRLLGGKDAASERYIYTKLNTITRLIYRPEDDPILEYLEDDGEQVEPIYYVPIIPMVLVNGSKGIGTGFSSDIMCYNVFQIIEKLTLMLNKKDHAIEITPYYNGFKGTIELIAPKKYLIKGSYTKINDNKINITELPIGVWTQDYKEFIETLMDSKDTKIIKDYSDMSTESNVNFVIEFYPGLLTNLLVQTTDISGNCHEKVTELEKLLKLYTTYSTNNMHLFDNKEHLKKYDSASSIIEDYYPVRYHYYIIRKEKQINKLKNELIILSNKARFILALLENQIDLRKKKDSEIVELLTNAKFNPNPENTEHPFNYLTKMPFDSVSEENVAKHLKEKNNKEAELKLLESKTIETIWLEELQEFKEEYMKLIDKNNDPKLEEQTKPTKATTSTTSTKPIKLITITKPQKVL